VGPDKQEGTLLNEPDYLDEAIEGFGTTESHYQWDEESPNDEGSSLFRASSLRALKRGYCNKSNDSRNLVMHYVNLTIVVSPTIIVHALADWQVLKKVASHLYTTITHAST